MLRIAHSYNLCCLQQWATPLQQYCCGGAGQASPPVCRLQNFAKVTIEARVNKRQAEKKMQEHKRATVMKEVTITLLRFMLLECEWDTPARDSTRCAWGSSLPLALMSALCVSGKVPVLVCRALTSSLCPGDFPRGCRFCRNDTRFRPASLLSSDCMMACSHAL